MSFELTGMDALLSKIRNIADNIPTFVTSDVQSVGDEAISRMQSDAPVDTGFLRANIGVTASSDIAIQLSSLAFYSVYVEFGTYKMGAEPFFFDNAVGAAEMLYEELLKFIQSVVK